MDVDVNRYPYYRIMWHFDNSDTMIEGSWYTSIFDDSLKPHVADLCKLYWDGKWPQHYQDNWYWEFKDYLISIGVEIKWKPR